jgi:hypothetical protein
VAAILPKRPADACACSVAQASSRGAPRFVSPIKEERPMSRLTRERLVALATSALLATAPAAAQAAELFGSSTPTLLRGTAPGDFAPPQFYGGDLLGAFPVALSAAQASAAVLGAPDNKFLSLPGLGNDPSGTAFTGAYVEVSFGTNFGTDSILSIWELGNNEESAQIWLWADNGGNVQFQFTRGAADLNTFDLSGYAATLALIGGTAFTKVGIGGLDQLGASKGFDLDAVAITAVPEPSTYALMLAGLGVVAWTARRRRRDD